MGFWGFGVVGVGGFGLGVEDLLGGRVQGIRRRAVIFAVALCCFPRRAG